MEMSKIIHEWLTRLMLILAIVSIILIGYNVTKCYKALVVQQFIDDYAESLRKSSTVGADNKTANYVVSNFDALQTQCARFGYHTTEITVTRVVVDKNEKHTYNESFTTKDFIDGKRFELEKYDFVHITTTNGSSVLQATYIHHAEEIE